MLDDISPEPIVRVVVDGAHMVMAGSPDTELVSVAHSPAEYPLLNTHPRSSVYFPVEGAAIHAPTFEAVVVEMMLADKLKKQV